MRVSPPALMPSIINQKEKIYNGIVIEICKTTTTQDGIVSRYDFAAATGKDNGVVGVGCLVGGGVKRTPIFSILQEEEILYTVDCFLSILSSFSSELDCWDVIVVNR
jgi:hypothetical protein